MTSRPRSDLYINLPALRKLDNMLLVSLASHAYFLFTILLNKRTFSNLLTSDKPLLPGNPGRIQRRRILVRGPGHLRAGLRRFRVLPENVPPPRRQVVAPGAPRAPRRPLRGHAEAGRAPARLRQPDPEGRHGHQQQRPGRDGRAGLLPRLAAKGRAELTDHDTTMSGHSVHTSFEHSVPVYLEADTVHFV